MQEDNYKFTNCWMWTSEQCQIAMTKAKKFVMGGDKKKCLIRTGNLLQYFDEYSSVVRVLKYLAGSLQRCLNFKVSLDVKCKCGAEK